MSDTKSCEDHLQTGNISTPQHIAIWCGGEKIVPFPPDPEEPQLFLFLQERLREKNGKGVLTPAQGMPYC